MRDSRHPVHTLQLTCAAIALALLSAVANGETRYVAASGKDANPCTLTPPCKSLQRGVDVTPGGSELRVLSSGTYGAAVIARSLTLSGDEFVTIGGRIFINAPGAAIVLRGLNLNGSGMGEAEGIDIRAAAVVHIENCTVERFQGIGIAATAQGIHLFVSHTVSRDNRDHGLEAYYNHPFPEVGSETLAVSDSSFDNNGLDGIILGRGTSTLTRTTVSHNNAHGIVQYVGVTTIASTAVFNNRSGGIDLRAVRATIDSTLSEANTFGLLFSGDNDSGLAVATISNSVFINNRTAGLAIQSGTIRTRGNNTVVDNQTNVIGTLTPIAGS